MSFVKCLNLEKNAAKLLPIGYEDGMTYITIAEFFIIRPHGPNC